MEMLDHLLYLQLITARLGEKELCDWWNTDIAYRLGGAGFLSRITGSAMAPFAAGEGILLAARIKEESLVDLVPGERSYSLFSPPSILKNNLNRRYSYYKRYADDVPKEITDILNPEKDWTIEALRDLLKKQTEGSTWSVEGTTAGREIYLSKGKSFSSGEEGLRSCAGAYLELGKKNFILHYFRLSV